MVYFMVLSRHEKLKKNLENPQDAYQTGPDSNLIPPEDKSKAFPIYQADRWNILIHQSKQETDVSNSILQAAERRRIQKESHEASKCHVQILYKLPY